MMNWVQFLNKYKFQFTTFCLLFGYITFLDQMNVPSLVRLIKKSSQLSSEIEAYDKKIVQVKQEEKEVLGDAQLTAKFARERYFMKKADEEVFVLVDNEGNFIEE